MSQCGERIFREGDKVLQTRNNYEKTVVNGDIGVLVSINTQAKFVVVAFADQMTRYDFNELDQLVHAFAMSVHKSQGSEFKIVVALLKAHYMLLQRNLFYTAITRARAVCRRGAKRGGRDGGAQQPGRQTLRRAGTAPAKL